MCIKKEKLCIPLNVKNINFHLTNLSIDNNFPLYVLQRECARPTPAGQVVPTPAPGHVTSSRSQSNAGSSVMRAVSVCRVISSTRIAV